MLTGVQAGGDAIVEFRFTNSNNCPSVVTYRVTINALPADKLSVKASEDRFCTNTNYILTANLPNGIWSTQNSNVFISNVTATTATVRSSVAQQVTIRYSGAANSNGCRAFTDFTRNYNMCAIGRTSNTQVNNTINEVPTVQVYPNPAADYVMIQSNIKNAQIIITDLMGRTILETKAQEQNTKVNISSLKAGMYLVTIFNETTRQTVRLQKM
jgi:hypothetical protein